MITPLRSYIFGMLSTLIAVTLLLAVTACSREAPELTGETMGTTYSVVVPMLKRSDQAKLKSRVDALLADVNNEMSTYQQDSSISRFNASESTEWFFVGQGFSVVAEAALKIATATEGAFDPTVGPLVKRWGFGKDKSTGIPDRAEISVLLDQIGFENLKVDTSKKVVKKKISTLEVDLNAIAKGYAVDLLATEVEAFGYSDYLAEIGGEIRANGKNAKGDPWRIGVERPEAGTSGKSAQVGLQLTAGGVATSGDYRNAFESDGVRYSHIIDARTGSPVQHDLASVTVVADSAMMADGWATALMVLGQDDGMKIAERLGLACLFIVRDAEQGFLTRSSSAFDRLERN